MFPQPRGAAAKLYTNLNLENSDNIYNIQYIKQKVNQKKPQFSTKKCNFEDFT